ncbi:MAG TPA: hypothetical protein GX530_07680, partial [Corynebacteriales bacterium]|nr:hypothetical protein [Mycobacteriales bacterium]
MITLKQVLTLSLAIIVLISIPGLAVAKPSLLPFNPEWTASEVRDLIAAGADVNAKDDLRKSSVLMYAIETCDNLEIINMLIAAGADVNAETASGSTPLLQAAGHNENPEIV